MSVFLKCQTNGASTAYEAQSSADKPYLAVAFVKRTGVNPSDTVTSASYLPLTTDSAAAGSPRIAVALTTQTGVQPSETATTVGYVHTGARTTTTTTYNITNSAEGVVRPYDPSSRGTYSAMYVSTSYYYPPASSASLRYVVHKTTETFYYPNMPVLFPGTPTDEVTSGSTGLAMDVTYQSKTEYLSSSAFAVFTNSESDIPPIYDEISSLYLAPFNQTVTSRSDGSGTTTFNFRVGLLSNSIVPAVSNRSISRFNYSIEGQYSAATSSSSLSGQYCLFTEDIHATDDENVTKKIAGLSIEMAASSSDYTTQQHASYSTYSCDASYTLWSASLPGPKAAGGANYYSTEIQVFSKSDTEYYDGTTTTTTTY